MKRTELLLAVVAVVAALVLTTILGPRPATLAAPATGDAKLAGRVAAALPARGHEQVAVAVIRRGKVSYAGFGADQDTRFELGSVTKAMTGMLLAAQVADGVVRLDQPVDSLLPGLPAGSATLQELSQHRSGLPRVPTGVRFGARAAVASLRGADPYAETPAQVIALAARSGLPGGADPAYSNLGTALLGNALGVADRTSYARALQTRLLRPLRMDQTMVVTVPAQLPVGRAIGRSGGNRSLRDPWIAEGWAPTGSGVWSTTADLARLCSAVLAGTAPGMAALDPRAPYSEGRQIGLNWIITERAGRTITWHNGGTGGFTSFVGLDRDAGTAVMVLSASDRSVDAAGLQLLAEAGQP